MSGINQEDFEIYEFNASSTQDNIIVNAGKNEITLLFDAPIYTGEEAYVAINYVNFPFSSPPNVTATTNKLAINFAALTVPEQVFTFEEGIYNVPDIGILLRVFLENLDLPGDAITIEGVNATQKIVFIVDPSPSTGDITLQWTSGDTTMATLFGFQTSGDLVTQVGQKRNYIAPDEANFSTFATYHLRLREIRGSTLTPLRRDSIVAVIPPAFSTPGTGVSLNVENPTHHRLPSGNINQFTFTIRTDTDEIPVFSDLAIVTIQGIIGIRKEIGPTKKRLHSNLQ